MRPVYRRPPVRLNRNEWAAFGAAAFAVLLWGLLPVLRQQAGAVPPLLTTAIALACAALVETLRAWAAELAAGSSASTDGDTRLPIGRGLTLAGTLVGAIGFYFLGLDWAPAARVTLITCSSSDQI